VAHEASLHGLFGVRRCSCIATSSRVTSGSKSFAGTHTHCGFNTSHVCSTAWTEIMGSNAYVLC
jgi:hypothetical protein